MKNIVIVLSLFVLFNCGSSGNGELIGAQDRPSFYGYQPLGTVRIPAGSYTQGQGDEDIAKLYQNNTRTVTVSSFYMDETEITNNEYRQFVNYVKDSLAYKILGEENPDEFLIPTLDDELNERDQEDWIINWDAKLDWSDEENFPKLVSELIYPENQRFYGQRELDVRKLDYEYFWIDYDEAAVKGDPVIRRLSNTEYNDDRQDHRSKMENEGYSFPVDQYEDVQRGRDLDKGYRNAKGQNNSLRWHSDRSRFIIKERINVYPDTLVWISDFTYSYNKPMARQYFSNPAYDDYPVVGVTWDQAKAFAVWRTNLLNNERSFRGEALLDYFRLPSEAEWEYAARGGNDQAPYPWGGYYTRNSKGCFLANFKPLRGRYIDDGGVYTVAADSYNRNDYGLYCMAGNVAEWTNTAFDPSMYEFAHDLNPEYEYNALDHDPISKKRKVIRGGSWKDIEYFLQVGTRTYEYKDTAKSYIGFRCVQSVLGREGNETTEDFRN